ncbi:MAG: polysaccharide deacetylase family protein [Ruminococcus sp.]|nr:polysaccharide deacetylase family protein [Ruminococcus sp.]
MENNNDRYDFSYFEDDMPYVSHKDRAALEKQTHAFESDDNVRGKTRRQSKKKPAFHKGRAIIIGGGVLLIALIVGIFVLIGSISAAVRNSALKTSDVTDTSVTFSWDKMNNVSGYSVYGKENSEKSYILMASVDDPDMTSVTVDSLNQASQYSFYIVSVKNGKESKFGTADKLFTLPSPPAMTGVTSESEGAVHIDWTPNDKADGYIAEYKSEAGEYSPDQRITVDSGSASSCDITGLEPAENYTVRMYSYMAGEEPIISPPSQEQSIRVSRTEAQTASGATYFDKYIDPKKPMVAFTFDDGPFDGVNSDRILDTLEQYNVTATFFMVGCYVEDHPDNLKRKVDLHMELGNHTWDHSKYGESITVDDIRRCSDAIYEVTGQRPTGFRPPGGAQGDAVLSEATAEGMAIYLWNVNSEDYESQNADAIYNMVMGTLADGNIIGMHDTYEATAEAVERLVPEILAQGYQIVSAHDLVVAKTGNEPEPGEVYYDFVKKEYE